MESRAAVDGTTIFPVSAMCERLVEEVFEVYHTRECSCADAVLDVLAFIVVLGQHWEVGVFLEHEDACWAVVDLLLHGRIVVWMASARAEVVEVHYITLHYITLHYITLHYTTSHYTTSHYITLHYITLHYIALHYITLHTYIHTYIRSVYVYISLLSFAEVVVVVVVKLYVSSVVVVVVVVVSS